MRRICSFLFLSLFGAFLGCHHVAGVCDCQPDSFCGCHRSYAVTPTSVPTTSVPVVNGSAAPLELPKAMPSGNIGEPSMLPTPTTSSSPKFN